MLRINDLAFLEAASKPDSKAVIGGIDSRERKAREGRNPTAPAPIYSNLI